MLIFHTYVNVYQRVTNTLIMKRWVLTLKKSSGQKSLILYDILHTYIYNSDYIGDASDRKSPICINGGGTKWDIFV